MVQVIEGKAQQCQEQQKQREEKEKDKSRNYTPVSSFLTQRNVDPDGFPRRAGQVSPRSLAEIVGDENIFALLHQYFVVILRYLGDRFGGMPVSQPGAFYQTTVDEKEPKQLHTDMVHNSPKTRPNNSSSSLGSKEVEAAIAKLRISSPAVTPSTPTPSARCGPLPSDQPSGPQVVV